MINKKHKALWTFLSILLIVTYSCSSDNGGEDNTPTSTVTTSNLTLSIDENPPNGLVLGQVLGSTDVGELTFFLEYQSPSNAMYIDDETGVLTVRDSVLFNYEVRDKILARVEVSNGEVTKTANITVTINDIYERYSYIGSIQLHSQSQVNAFGAEDHWGVSGSLSIGNNQGDINDLSPLASIINVGTLIIRNINFSFIDLQNIVDIEYSLRIDDNPQITSLDGLHNIISIGNDIDISDNNHLIDLSALSSVSSIGGNLFISHNNSLININGLNSITEIGGNITIKFHSSLTNINGLIDLQTVGGDLNIYNNGVLRDFCGISTLIISQGLMGNYNVLDNFYNPTQQDIIDGNCSN